MTFNFLNRKVHYWTSVIFALPVLVILTTGFLLQIKKQWTWVQPPEQKGVGKTPTINLEHVLSAVQALPERNVSGWTDISRVDIRPSKGIAKVTLKDDWEVQVDMETGKVLQSAYRRSDLIETLHDGSFFAGDITKLGLFLPSAVALLLLWCTGLWMFWLPIAVRRRKAKGILSRTAK
ncbi:PepSY domain-containing protein [Armatimonas sp.]|uniref:PepSY domain-containing protein n=1 Tax=Armatimonas sp. TaxID=1872638 RepID=UPI003752C7A7